VRASILRNERLSVRPARRAGESGRYARDVAIAVSSPGSTSTPPRRPENRPGTRLVRHDVNLGRRFVAGADEAGRGALAGPLVTAAVLLEPAALRRAERTALWRLDDSKRVPRPVREQLFGVVIACARRFAVTTRSARDIDERGITWADLGGMATCMERLDAPDETVFLVDGFRLPELRREHRRLIGGDGRSAAIAAAAILAKVSRDRVMHRAADRHPLYGFERHVGYGTTDHLVALREHGPCPLHRRSFAPCAQPTLL
jgi:ribonuclease HII